MKGYLKKMPIVASAFEFRYMGGSMGSAVGNAIIQSAELAINKNAPLVIFPSSGGARMQEGILSLMQLPRTIIATQMIKEAELEQDYLRIQDDRSKYKTDVEYKKALLEIEMTKIANDNIKHQNLLELEKVSEGKVTTVFMPDADGNMKEYRVRNYYDYDTQKFETDIIGIAPPDQDYIDEVKPFKTKLREYVSGYEKLEQSSNLTTDFKFLSTNSALGPGPLL